MGLVSIPVLRVSFRFAGVDEAQRHAFMKRFDLCMQRGGGWGICKKSASIPGNKCARHYQNNTALGPNDDVVMSICGGGPSN